MGESFAAVRCSREARRAAAGEGAVLPRSPHEHTHLYATTRCVSQPSSGSCRRNRTGTTFTWCGVGNRGPVS